MNTNVRKEKRGVFSMTNVVTADTVAPVELFDRILYCVERARAQGKSVRQLGLTIGSAGKVQRWIERGGIAKVNPDDLRVIARETGVRAVRCGVVASSGASLSVQGREPRADRERGHVGAGDGCDACGVCVQSIAFRVERRDEFARQSERRLDARRATRC
jgi:membrane-bound ClpP family serine protease